MQVENFHASDWKAVQETVSRTISESSDPFDPTTVANVRDLIDACRELCPAPNSTAKGYWSTICFFWDNLEVEVCEDHYEFYRFKQGETDIEHFDHTCGASFPTGLMNLLPKVPPLRDSKVLSE